MQQTIPTRRLSPPPCRRTARSESLVSLLLPPLVLLFLLVVGALPASANIIQVYPDTKYLTPPGSLDLREGPPLETDVFNFAFQEQSLIALPPGITVNAIQFGIYVAPFLISQVLTPGQTVDTHYIYYDPDVKWFGGWDRTSGSVIFDDEIVGVIATKADLMASHGSLGGPHTYPDAADDEGIEWGNYRDEDFFHIFSVGGEKRGLLYSFGAVNDVDTLRVLTKATLPGQ